MLRLMSEEEELESRRAGFGKLKPGSLFDLGQERFFIAVKKMSVSENKKGLRAKRDIPSCLYQTDD